MSYAKCYACKHIITDVDLALYCDRDRVTIALAREPEQPCGPAAELWERCDCERPKCPRCLRMLRLERISR